MAQKILSQPGQTFYSGGEHKQLWLRLHDTLIAKFDMSLRHGVPTHGSSGFAEDAEQAKAAGEHSVTAEGGSSPRTKRPVATRCMSELNQFRCVWLLFATSRFQETESMERDQTVSKAGVTSKRGGGAATTCEHNRQRSRCIECGGSGICEHCRQRRGCIECGGSAICEHKKQRSRCIQCGGSGICEHKRQQNQCKECKGSNFCEHGRQRAKCKD
eukprot:3897845-Rhodomonas_salina.2